MSDKRDAIREKCEEIAVNIGVPPHQRKNAADAIHSLVRAQRKEVWEKAALFVDDAPDGDNSFFAETLDNIARGFRRLAAEEAQEGEADHG